MSSKNIFKSDIDHYLYEVAKEYIKKKQIKLWGGAALLLNYNFRNQTTDIDSIIIASSNIKEIIKQVAEKYDLTYDWINDDFKKHQVSHLNWFNTAHFTKSFVGAYP